MHINNVIGERMRDEFEFEGQTLDEDTEGELLELEEDIEEDPEEEEEEPEDDEENV